MLGIMLKSEEKEDTKFCVATSIAEKTPKVVVPLKTPPTRTMIIINTSDNCINFCKAVRIEIFTEYFLMFLILYSVILSYCLIKKEKIIYFQLFCIPFISKQRRNIILFSNILNVSFILYISISTR